MATHDYSDLAGFLRAAARKIPDRVDDIMAEVAGAELPAIKAATPVLTGRLRGATRVQRMAGGKVQYVNPQVYANTIHWGRKMLNGNPSVVEPTQFVFGTLDRDQPEINRRITQELERAFDRLG